MDADLKILKHYLELLLDKAGVQRRGDVQAELEDAFASLTERLETLERFKATAVDEAVSQAQADAESRYGSGDWRNAR